VLECGCSKKQVLLTVIIAQEVHQAITETAMPMVGGSRLATSSITSKGCEGEKLVRFGKVPI
jgi:hypothetical protein